MKISKAIAQATCILLTATLLTACTGTSTGGSGGTAPAASASQVASVAAADAAVLPVGAYKMLRGPWGYTDDSPLYLTETIQREGAAYSTYVDLRTLAQHYLCTKGGCAHSGPDCDAYQQFSDMAANHLYASILTQDSIYWADGSDSLPGHFYQSALDSTEETLLFSLGDEMVAVPRGDGTTDQQMKYQWGGMAFATDGSYYYQTVRVTTVIDGATLFTTQLWRINPTTDTHEVLYETAPYSGIVSQNLLVGCTDDALILDELAEPVDSGSLQQNDKAAQHSVFLLARDGTKTPVYQYQRGDYAAVPLAFDNTMYCLLPDATTLQTVSLVTGEVKTITQGLPASQHAALLQPHDGYAFVDTLMDPDATSHLSQVNLATGEITENALSFYHNGHATPMPILTAIGEDYLVVMEEKAMQYTFTDEQGTVNVIDSAYTLPALISKVDYLAGNANYREIAMLPRA